MHDRIEIVYKGSKIEFDTHTEEWRAKMNTDYMSGEDTFKTHKSLQKLKDAIDRFNKKDFKEIPIIIFKGYDENEATIADIISFTNVPGECWIRYRDGKREKINTAGRGYSVKKIYACGNVANEPILLKIDEYSKEIKRIEEELKQKKKEKIHLIDSLQPFDIGGYASEPDIEE